MEKRDTDILIAKWLAGEITDDELVEQESQETLDAFRAITQEMEQWSIPPVDKEKGMQRLQTAIEDTKKETKVIPLNRSWFVGIAAAITLLVVSYLFFFQSDLQTIETLAGQTETIELPDGSMATINSSSSLSFSTKTWPTKRKVKLKGEAYFEVARGSKFTVELDDSKVEVLGTKFNVRKRGNFLAVDCYEGKVGISINNSDSTSVIVAGESLKFDGVNVERGELEDSKPIWITGNATKFKNAALGDVFASLKAQFGVQLEIDKRVDLSRKYSGSFLHSNVEVALKMVCEPLSLNFKQKGNGTYQIY